MLSTFINLVCWSSTILLIFHSVNVHSDHMQYYDDEPILISPERVIISKGTVKRETVVSKIPKLNAKSSFCALPTSAIDDICRACTEVHQSVYNKFKYRILKDTPAGDCELRDVDMVHNFNDTVQVYVRSCPLEPELYLSQGNKPGWVLIFLPGPKPKELRFAIHVGPFDNRKFFSSVWHIIKSLIPF